MPLISPQVRALCFDAVGTLIHPDPPAHFVYAEIGQRHGSRLSSDLICERFSKAFAEEEDRDAAAQFRTSEERERQRWQRIVGSVLSDVADANACFQELYEHFSQPTAWRCTPAAAEILSRLAARYPLALASNYDWRLRPVVAGLPELQPISRLVISSEVGWRKPAPEFFRAVCAALALPPQSILFIGDDHVNDYQGARAAGLDALLLAPVAAAQAASISGLDSLLPAETHGDSQGAR